MKVISILTDIGAKPILYSLATVASDTGRVLVITDNTDVIAIMDEVGNLSVGSVDFKIIPFNFWKGELQKADIMENLGAGVSETYDTLIVSSTTALVRDAEFIVKFTWGTYNSLMEVEPDNSRVFVIYANPTSKDSAKTLKYDSEMLAFIHNCDTKKALYCLNREAVIKLVGLYLQNVIGIEPIEVKKYLKTKQLFNLKK